jgi:hypothetical protein
MRRPSPIEETPEEDQFTGRVLRRQNFGQSLLVEKVEFLSWLETDGFTGGDADFGACAGIATDPGFARADIENAEAAQLDALSLGESALEALEYSIHGSLRLVALKAGTLDHMVNDVLFYQGFLRSGEQSAPRLIVETFSRIVNAPALL